MSCTRPTSSPFPALKKCISLESGIGIAPEKLITVKEKTDRVVIWEQKCLYLGCKVSVLY